MTRNPELEPILTTCIIASAGGHLQQARFLSARLGVGSDRVIVTYRRSDAPDEMVVASHHPTTKNVPNALRNYSLARRFFSEHDITRVVSTGAGIAVPFVVRARQLGIPCHYIESATRVNGPSLTARMLARVQGVHLYRQMGQWGQPRWQQGPCVFDGYATQGGAARKIERVVVSLGTHGFGFPRAISALRSLLDRPGYDVLWQLGSTPDPGGLPGRVVDRLPPTELQAEVDRADVVVGHAGVGSSLMALAAGKVPVLLPRRRQHREHTDDHQVQLAGELERRGLAVSADIDDLTPGHLLRASSLVVRYTPPLEFHLVD